jgi:hypothetical protein
MSDKFKAQIYSFCFQADTSVPYKLKFVAGLANAIDSSISRGQIVGKDMSDPNVQSAIKLIKSKCNDINSYYDAYVQIVDAQYKSMDYSNNYANIWKFRPTAIDQIMGGTSISDALNNWKKSLSGASPSTTQTTPSTSQSSDFKQGQTYKMVRSVNNKIYDVKIEKYVPAEKSYAAKITGQGMYQGESFSNGLNLYLFIEKPGVLSGNSELGTFTIKK